MTHTLIELRGTTVVWQLRERGVLTTVHFYDDGRIDAVAELKCSIPMPHGGVPFEYRRCELHPDDLARAKAAYMSWDRVSLADRQRVSRLWARA